MTNFYRQLYLALCTLSLVISTTILPHPTMAKSPAPQQVETSPNLVVEQTAVDALKIGRQQYQAGQYSLAIATLETAIQQAENEPLLRASALTNLALAQRQMGLWNEAQKSLEQAKNTLLNNVT